MDFIIIFFSFFLERKEETSSVSDGVFRGELSSNDVVVKIEVKRLVLSVSRATPWRVSRDSGRPIRDLTFSVFGYPDGVAFSVAYMLFFPFVLIDGRC